MALYVVTVECLVTTTVEVECTDPDPSPATLLEIFMARDNSRDDIHVEDEVLVHYEKVDA